MKNDSILTQYSSPHGGYDECYDSSGSLRPSWKFLDSKLRQFSESDLTGKNEFLEKLISDNGITYNVYSEEERHRSWTMDLLPLVFSNKEWKDLEDSLQQRAELINTALVDLYSEQKVLKNAILPPYLIYANPTFLRSCFGIKPLNNRYIHLYSADLARSTDGSWWVLNDRIEAASGLGYVMENRMLSNRALPEFFRDQNITRLRPFYDQFSKTVRSLGPDSTEGRVALLTPGTANETYFEQSFLCKNLGFELVEGADLTVRNNKLYFKNLKGIHPIQSLIRRLDSEWCDPLELRNDSLLGVPALLDCMRNQTLGMMNCLGSGVMETVAIPAFMNSLSNFYLGEDLKSKSVATWWCGQPRELEFVLQNLDHLVIKRTFRNRADKAIFTPALKGDELDKLKAEIQSSPEHYCAQEIVSTATAPTYIGGKLLPHHFLVRVYLLHTETGYQILPGGFARIAPDTSSHNVSMQHGAMSKDVWVLDETKNRPSSKPVIWNKDEFTLKPFEDDISSRTANNFYWFGRYLERIENTNRTLKIIITALIEDYHISTFHTLTGFLKTLLSPEEYKELSTGNDAAETMRKLDIILHRYIWERDYFNSLSSGFNNLGRIAYSIKDRLSTDTWQIISNMEKILIRKTPKNSNVIHTDSIVALEEALDWIAALSGKSSDNMSRSLGWHFMMLGKRIERSMNLIDFLNSTTAPETDISEENLLLMLNYSDSSISYRNRYLNHFEVVAVVYLMVKDSNNPRSLSFCIERIISHLGELPWNQNRKGNLPGNPLQNHSSGLVDEMSKIQARDIVEGKDVLVPLESALSSIHQSVEQCFFAQI